MATAAPPVPHRSAARLRRPDIDALRAAAVVLVLAVHAAQVYSPWQDWHIQNDGRSILLAHAMLFAGPWLMPLFMMLAGRSTWYSLQHRSDRAWIAERFRRLFVPLAAGTFLLVPPQLWIRRLGDGSFDGSFLQFYPRFFDGLYPEGNLSWGHLWFLAYLLLYSVMTLPLLRRLGRWTGGHVALLVGVTALGQVLLRARFPQTNALVGDWANHALLLPAFLAGCGLSSSPSLEAALVAQRRRLLAVAITASAVVALLASADFDRGLLNGTSPGYVPFWIAFTLAGWAWMLGLSASARVHVRHAVGRRTRELVYPFYLFHQTVLVLIAWLLTPAPLPILLEFPLLLGLAFAATTGTSYLASCSAGGRVLFGIPGRDKWRAPV